MKILLPRIFDDSGALSFSKQLWSSVKEPDLVLDFSQVKYVFPFGMLLIAQAISLAKLFRQKKLDLNTSAIIPNDYGGATSYLKFFGFFKHIGFNVGNDVNEAPGGSRYLPITVINSHSLDEAGSRAVMQDEVVATCDRLASIMFSLDSEASAVDMVSYCLREIMRNAFEHGNVKKCYTVAQRWYDGTVEIAIADRGRGIFDSLKECHNVESAVSAIQLSLRPGISRSAHLGSEQNKWSNSGFGLFVVSQLGARYGSFSIASSRAYVCPSDEIIEVGSIIPPGTVVKLKIKTNDSEYWPNILANIVAEGETIAKIEGAPVTKASSGSKSGSKG